MLNKDVYNAKKNTNVWSSSCTINIRRKDLIICRYASALIYLEAQMWGITVNIVDT